MFISLVEAQFKASWRHPVKPCPPVRYIYKIVSDKASLDKYNAYRYVELLSFILSVDLIQIYLATQWKLAVNSRLAAAQWATRIAGGTEPSASVDWATKATRTSVHPPPVRCAAS